MMKCLLIGIFVFLSFLLKPQQDLLQFSFYNPKIKLYVVGEDHYQDNSEVQLAVISYLREKASINTLFLEVPVEVGKIMNEFVLTGSKEEELKKVMSLFNSSSRSNLMSLLTYAQLINRGKAEGEKIEIVGIDMLSFDTYNNQRKALTYLFPEFKNCHISIIEKYLTIPEKRNVKKNNRVKIFDSLLIDLDKNQDFYRSCLDERLETYKNQIIEIKYNYAEGWKMQDSIRESILTRNLINEIDTNKVQLLICGASHALSLKNDDWYYGYPFTTMVANAKSQFPNSIFSIITQYYEKKLFRFFEEFNLLSTPTKSYFTNKTIKYAVIQNLELHPAAVKRCDMIIIQNEQYKDRK